MSDVNDLATLLEIKQWLSISNNVNTSIAAAIAPGTQTVTPASMANIVPGYLLTVDIGAAQEEVQVLTTTGTTFTAAFANSHLTLPIPVTAAATDAVLARLITSSSYYLLAKMSRTTFNPVLNYNEVRNGNGGQRMALRFWPVTAVNSVTVDGISVPKSPDGVQAGWSSDGVSVFLIGSFNIGFPRFAPGASPGLFRSGFQNVQFNYNYNPPVLPPDVVQACVELVSLKQVVGRQKIGLKSEALTGIGTNSYITGAVPDSVQAVIDKYKIRYLFE
jgi:hypothetical protein